MIGKKNSIERQMKSRPLGESEDGFRDLLRKLQLEKDAVTDIGMEYFEKYKYENASWKSHTDGTHVTYLSLLNNISFLQWYDTLGTGTFILTISFETLIVPSWLY